MPTTTVRENSNYFDISRVNKKFLMTVAFFIGLVILTGLGSIAVIGVERNMRIHGLQKSQMNVAIKRSLNRPAPNSNKMNFGFQNGENMKDSKFDIPVLTYHYIEAVPADQLNNPIAQGLRVSPQVFDEELTYLEKNSFTTLSIQDYSDILAGLKQRPTKPILLTFDDGYKNNYDNAFPLLKKHKMIGNFALITGVLGTLDYMSWDNAKEMSQAGMGIMSHTVWHCPLAEKKKIDGKTIYLPNSGDDAEKPCKSFTDAGVLSIGQVSYELKQSKKQLEEKLGIKVSSFVYPYGNFNQQTVAETKKAGYELAFTTLGNLPPDFEEHNLVIPRYDIHGQQSGPLIGFFNPKTISH